MIPSGEMAESLSVLSRDVDNTVDGVGSNG